MSTKEKLISHVMKEEPVGSRNKVTVVGVGMVGMASAISILLKVRGANRETMRSDICVGGVSVCEKRTKRKEAAAQQTNWYWLIITVTERTVNMNDLANLEHGVFYPTTKRIIRFSK